MKPLKNDASRAPAQRTETQPIAKTEAAEGPPAASEPQREHDSQGFKAEARPGARANAAPANTEPVALSTETKGALVRLKGTCPFIGSAMATEALPIRNSADQPLAKIDDVVKLGNSGGGILGQVLKLFATGNHAKMMGASGKLDREVPPGTFSLDLPASQGSHPGHSGILQGDPLALNSGRFSDEDFGRLLARAKDGYVTRSDVGKFIAENLMRDPKSKVLGPRVAAKLGLDALGAVGRVGPAVLESIENRFRHTDTHEAQRDAVEALTKLLGEDNLVGSSVSSRCCSPFSPTSPARRRSTASPRSRSKISP